MSQFNLDDDLVLDYVAECREHLSTIESDLLAIEDNANSGSGMDEQLVNRVFRAAHSIKGGAGFFDLTQIKELAHRTESVLDLMRTGELMPNSEIVNILLGAFDRLGAMILDYAGSNSVDISDFTTALTQLAEANLPANQKDIPEETIFLTIPDAGKVIGVSSEELDRARRNGRSIFAIAIDTMNDVHERGRTPLDLLNILSNGGDILATEFDFDFADDDPSSVEDLTKGRRLDVVFASNRSLPEIAADLALPLRCIRFIENRRPVLAVDLQDVQKTGIAPPVVEIVPTKPVVVSPPKPSAAPVTLRSAEVGPKEVTPKEVAKKLPQKKLTQKKLPKRTVPKRPQQHLRSRRSIPRFV